MCIRPIYLESKNLYVPCGKCIDCQFKRTKNHIQKCYLESCSRKVGLFITLTYNEDHVGDNILDYTEFQKFMKRLRIRLRRYFGFEYKLSYFVVGEYGSLHGRKHWHLLLFSDYYIPHEVIDKCWGFGFIKVNKVNSKNIRYVASYVNKFSSKYGKKINAIYHFSQRLGRQFYLDNKELIHNTGCNLGKYNCKYLYKQYLKDVKDPLILSSKFSVVDDNQLNSYLNMESVKVSDKMKKVKYSCYMPASVYTIRDFNNVFPFDWEGRRVCFGSQYFNDKNQFINQTFSSKIFYNIKTGEIKETYNYVRKYTHYPYPQ